MKTFTLASIVALATVGSAQLNNIPSCALNCFIGPLTSNGCNGLTDFACHCKQGAQLLGTVQPCVQGACKADDQATTIAAVEKTCEDAGVPIEIPAGTSAAGSAVASATSAAASAVQSVTSEAAEATSSAAAAVSSAVQSAASSIASAISSAASAASSHASTASSNGTATATSSSISQFTGAATQATQAAGLLGAAALALLAL